MITYSFLQHYWWFIISLLGGILVFLLFVQGANTMIFSLGKTSEERRLVINSTGRKWEFTFTTLVTFGGAFFASFPLFYSTSFGGAYWLWMIILFSFVIQAVSYEFQNKIGNFLGPRTFQICLVINGIVGPLLLGGAVATFFDGSNFTVDKMNIANSFQPVISRWANASCGLDALLDIYNVIFGIAVLFLARVLGLLYMTNNIDDDSLRQRMRRSLIWNSAAFLVFFLIFFVHVLVKDGYAYYSDGVIVMEPMKYLHNLFANPFVLILLLAGVVSLLAGIIMTIVKSGFIKGIWLSGFGTVMAVTAIFLMAGWNNTAYYPSNVDLQSSLTIANSCSSEFTLRTMAVVSLLVPFVLAYIYYAWRSIDSKKLDRQELKGGDIY
ncbi:cytochrome D ubiquinol oxidase subunit II [Prevotella lacticifex]|jgi:cytochrome d ubiquinol oxidase subunit II|uniref:Cytochrome D ubiquinol oxidase subunit II n=1 Tax=Prevotella lacticifex TaxID=2854755 RepID=A0A9R1CX27_9BACT|nr:cytochrome D ubiquinol oxidase subunit II [Prevotella lacticifex]GJG40166.1 cytochrome D ubiquinol oxidase subunit II [Prevotella lacticifex]GJG43861.1 cytochrome D ubiquinol oxidase subunit II [Prevotella lacticifex]GJG46544.1 cytochrome D ubiquinol oxidase subunit II [Prevotella lacticifex]GJG49705.1 cytochrome D ubiquinol oxidase subunit II [Prevotella lacticifex]